MVNLKYSKKELAEINNMSDFFSMYGDEEVLIPRRVTLETIFGCNASCIMCPIDSPTERKKGIMPLDTSNYILEEFVPYKNMLEKMDFFGLGEPLLDPYIFDRISYAKELGFKNLAFSTNADKLTPELQSKILKTGIDTVIFSIDGIKKETHESIRRNVDYNRVVNNCRNIIKMRDEYGYNTRFLIRFIKQEKNQNEWNDFRNYWLSQLSSEKNDLIALYDAHSWAGQVTTKDQILQGFRDSEVETMPCHHLYTLTILADGTIPLCSEDIHKPYYSLGNIKDDSPINIFNNEMYWGLRQLHATGKRQNMDLCKDCTILYSEKSRNIESIKLK